VTDDNKAANAQGDLARAGECLREAAALASAGLPYGATSRAYYAVFHAARALLFSVGLEARSHRAVASLVGEHFVKTGRLSSDLGRLVSRLQRDREDADYGVGSVFTADEADKAIADARRFADEVRRLLGA